MDKIGIIGFGHMGQAIAQNLKQEPQYLISFFDSKKIKSSFKQPSYLKNLISDVQIIILSVKPQNFSEVRPDLERYITSKHIVISIIAGVSLKNLSGRLKTKNIIRTMPNLALACQASLTGWIALKGCSRPALNAAKKIISLWGKEINCAQEDQLNTITAAAGSGPAYFLMIAEQIYKFCQKQGFSESESLIISRQVLKGAGDYYFNQNLSPSEVIEKITSKKGTTEAAFKYFKKHRVPTYIIKGIQKAQQRSRQLSA